MVVGEEMLDNIFIAKGLSHQADTNTLKSEEFESRYRLALSISPLISMLINSTENLFETDLDKDGNCVAKFSPLGRRLLKLRLDCFELIKEYPDYRWNPYFELFYAQVRKHDFQYLVSMVGAAKRLYATHLVQLLNDFVHDVRKEARSKSFKVRLKNFLRPARENNVELSRYVETLFKCHARMLVVRIDLSYKERYRKIGSKISVELAKIHRRKLLNILKKGDYGPLFGYAWKFEKGVRKGLHFHVLLFFDGSKVRKDVLLGKMIGERWESEITEGMGAYYNCNAFKEGYDYCGIGMVHYGDSVALEGLRRIVLYMTKLDDYFKLAICGVRSFGKGVAPGQVSPARGRPRFT